MSCNCSNWDDERPCPRHNPKMPQPDMVLHDTIVVRVYRRRSDKKWNFVVVRDALLTHTSEFIDTKPKPI